MAFVVTTFGLIGYYGIDPVLACTCSSSPALLGSGNGICLLNTVCYLLCIRNFGSSSGVAESLATWYLGLICN